MFSLKSKHFLMVFLKSKKKKHSFFKNIQLLYSKYFCLNNKANYNFHSSSINFAAAKDLYGIIK